MIERTECNTESYDYNLPKELIADSPLMPKGNAKLMVYVRQEDKIIHTKFSDFFRFVPDNSLIVLNDTKVIKARIFGNKKSGGKIELLYHSHVDKGLFLAQIRGKVSDGDTIYFDNNLSVLIKECLSNGMRYVEFYKNDEMLQKDDVLRELEQLGYMPLPPYIKRKSNINDDIAYQSVFADKLGAIAAPTASLHFDNNDLEMIKQYNHCFITLHIGAGTFFNVTTSDIRKHKMHEEEFNISMEAKSKIDQSNDILCIGTTSCRCVEYYARSGKLHGQCDIFINPFNKPVKTRYLLTNFHLPKSSLIMLVAGFLGLKKTMEIYKSAIDNRYRFYSYGDGMLII